jgi:hypothetical protein
MLCRRRFIPTFVIAGAVAVLAAGCGGGGSSPSSAARSGAAASDPAGAAVAFAACIRSHGLSSYPDPVVSESGNRTNIKISPGGIDPNSAAFKSASRACGHLLPGGGAPSAVTPQEQQQDLAFAGCMRSHGVASFPDPDHDGVFTLPNGIDQQAPEFQRATKACANVEPSSLSILNQPPLGS